MKRTIIVLLVTLFTIPHYSFAQQFLFENGRRRQAINFTFIRNLMIVPIYINDKGPYDFILDTGVGPLIITEPSLLQELHIQNLRPIKINGLGKGAEINALLSNDPSARIGSAIMANIPTAILKDDIFDLSGYVGQKIYGLLGYQFFNSFVVSINYAQNRLVFYEAGRKKKIKGEKIPITLINDKPYITIAVLLPGLGNTELKVVLDNGASHAISLETLNNQPFPIPETAIHANLGMGLGGPISGSLGRVPSLKIGSLLLKNVIAAYPAYEDVAAKSIFSNRNGNLGAEILSRFNITLDYANRFIYLKPNLNFKRPFQHDMSGIEIYAVNKGKTRFFISRIEDNSPAEAAGLLVDDEITDINFNPTSKLTLNDVLNLFKSGDGKNLILYLARDGETLVKVIQLKNRI